MYSIVTHQEAVKFTASLRKTLKVTGDNVHPDAAVYMVSVSTPGGVKSLSVKAYRCEPEQVAEGMVMAMFGYRRGEVYALKVTEMTVYRNMLVED